MIAFKKLKTISGASIDLIIENTQEEVINAEDLTILPAVIDPHVHFRTPGMEHKEDWRCAAHAAIRGGCTTVFDMPNTKPPTITANYLSEKKQIINQQLQEANIPLRYQLFFGADKHHLNEISKVRDDIIGIKVFMGCSTGNLVIDDDESLQAVFSIAAANNLLVAVHAEDEYLMRERKANFKGEMRYNAHSEIRNIEVATRAVAKAIGLSKQYGTRLYILHVSSAEEIALIKHAKKSGLKVFAETTPHHLFFNTNAYERLEGKAVVNPPLRDARHQEVLFAAIHEGIIDTIGSDHAPHTLAEKNEPYGVCPSGMPGIEFMLPLLLDAHHKGMLSLAQVVSLTSQRAKEIFHLPTNEDAVIVDLEKVATVNKTVSKCNWTPYAGMTLRGWPVYTILRDRVYAIEE